MSKKSENKGYEVLNFNKFILQILLLAVLAFIAGYLTKGTFFTDDSSLESNYYSEENFPYWNSQALIKYLSEKYIDLEVTGWGNGKLDYVKNGESWTINCELVRHENISGYYFDCLEVKYG